MNARKASCGTVAPKVGGEVGNTADSASYALLKPLMGGRMPDPAIFARVIHILQEMKNLDAAIAEGHALVEQGIAAMRAEGDRRLLPLVVEMEELRQRLRAAVDADATGAIHASLTRIWKGAA